MYVQTFIRQRVYEDSDIGLSYSEAEPIKSVVSDSINHVIDNVKNFREWLDFEHEHVNEDNSIKTTIMNNFDATSKEWKCGQAGTILIKVKHQDHSMGARLKYTNYIIFVQNTEVGYGLNK